MEALSHSLSLGLKMRNFLICLLLLFVSLSNLYGDKWTPSLSLQEIMAEAESGSPYYMGLLAIYLRSGEAGCKVNLSDSQTWSEASWDQGHPFGAYNLANLAMLRGDFSKATRFYQDAALLLQRRASEGDPVAMYCMGEIDFQVIPTHIPRALGWFEKSADAGYAQSQATYGALLLKGLPGLLKKDTKKGIEYLSKAVKSKSLTARFNLGMAYYNGDGVKKDIRKSIQWLSVAESQNFAEAQYVLGKVFYEGDDLIGRDQEKGISYLRKASTQSHPLAKKYLSSINAPAKNQSGYMRTALNSRPSSTKPSTLSEQPVKRSFEEAKRYYTGVGQPQDYQKAFNLLLPYAQSGHAEASRLVGLMCFTGKGTNKNFDEARKWLTHAAQRGDLTAERMLEQYKSLFD